MSKGTGNRGDPWGSRALHLFCQPNVAPQTQSPQVKDKFVWLSLERRLRGSFRCVRPYNCDWLSTGKCFLNPSASSCLERARIRDDFPGFPLSPLKPPWNLFSLFLFPLCSFLFFMPIADTRDLRCCLRDYCIRGRRNVIPENVVCRPKRPGRAPSPGASY